MVRVEVEVVQGMEKIIETRPFIAKACKSTLISLFSMISSFLHTAIAGGEGILDYVVFKERMVRRKVVKREIVKGMSYKNYSFQDLIRWKIQNRL